VNAKILKTLEAIEKTEGVWEQNQNWQSTQQTFDYGLKTKYASIPRSTGKIISELVLQRKPGKILEIGSSVGYSTLWLALAAEEINAKIFTTEINPSRIQMAKLHFKMADVESMVTLFPKDAHLVIGELAEQNQQVDLVFLDAFKKEYLAYIDELYPIIRSGGAILIDNVKSHANLLIGFSEKLSKDSRYSYEKIEQDNGILILTKIN
jgi:predicted O-methyltransferase YrrM